MNSFKVRSISFGAKFRIGRPIAIAEKESREEGD
jgi:hypothetical protein